MHDWVVATQMFFIFTPAWGDDPIWLIFFKWVETHQVDEQIGCKEIISTEHMRKTRGTCSNLLKRFQIVIAHIPSMGLVYLT